MPSLTRREPALLAAAAAAGPTAAGAVQIRSGPGAKYTELLSKDLKGVPNQMTRLTVMDVAPGTLIPWHYHPFAQEIIYGLQGELRWTRRPAKAHQAGRLFSSRWHAAHAAPGRGATGKGSVHAQHYR